MGICGRWNRPYATRYLRARDYGQRLGAIRTGSKSGRERIHIVTVNLDNDDKPIQAMVRSEHCRFPNLSFLQFAVAQECEGVPLLTRQARLRLARCRG